MCIRDRGYTVCICKIKEDLIRKSKSFSTGMSGGNDEHVRRTAGRSKIICLYNYFHVNLNHLMVRSYGMVDTVKTIQVAIVLSWNNSYQSNNFPFNISGELCSTRIHDRTYQWQNVPPDKTYRLTGRLPATGLLITSEYFGCDKTYSATCFVHL